MTEPSPTLCLEQPRRWLACLLLIAVAAVVAAPISRADETPYLTRVWQSEDGLPGNVVRSVVQDLQGFLWVATAEGIARFDGQDFRLIEPEGGQHRAVLSFTRLFVTPSGAVLASTSPGGLFRFDGDSLIRVLGDIRPPNAPRVTAVRETDEGTLWVQRGEKTYHLGPDGARPERNPPPQVAAALQASSHTAAASLTDHHGNLWLAETDAGLTVQAPHALPRPVLLPRGESIQTVNELMEDREGSIWAATSAHGLVKIRPAKMTVLDARHGLQEPAVSALLEDRTGTWWLANRGGGIDRITEGVVTHLELSGRDYRPVAAIFEDSTGRIWVAARDGSVFLFEGERFVPQFVRTQLPSKVRAITEDASGRIWFGGSLGIISLQGDQVEQHPLPGEDTNVSSLALSPDGRLIAGTTNGRVFVGEGGTFRDAGGLPPPHARWISAIHPAGPNEIWFTTLGGGLVLWTGNSWHPVADDQGIPDLRLTTLLADDDGNFWFGSLAGILRASRKELLAAAKYPGKPVRWLQFDRSDGMPSRECIGGAQPAGWRGADGRLWVPTSGGVVRIRPDQIELNEVPPPVFLESVRTNGAPPLDPHTPVNAGRGQARLEFQFTGISLAAPEKVTYRTRLAGLDGEWRDNGTQRTATFEAVPPGSYTFEVLAVNNDGIPSRTAASIPVTIRPYFWQRPSFLLASGGGLLLFAAGSGWLVARSRMKRRMALMQIHHTRENERSRIARDLHDDLGASLTEISILAALAAEDASGSELHPSLDQLSQKAKHVVGTLDEIVWAVNPREDTLRSLIDYLAAFAREFLDLGGVALRTEIPREIPDRSLAAGQRHSVFLATRESLHNILKHARASEVRLAVTTHDHLLEIRIHDNGTGFDPAQGRSGDGLPNLRHRMAEAGGTCEIQSAPGAGTTVTLSLPIPNSADRS
jgi:signal transduction histidine kinase/ligand-binding sensor domain-containing protein